MFYSAFDLTSNHWPFPSLGSVLCYPSSQKTGYNKGTFTYVLLPFLSCELGGSKKEVALVEVEGHCWGASALSDITRGCFPVS